MSFVRILKKKEYEVYDNEIIAAKLAVNLKKMIEVEAYVSIIGNAKSNWCETLAVLTDWVIQQFQ